MMLTTKFLIKPDAMHYPDASDEQLLLHIRLKKLDANCAFSELYDRYHGRVASYCVALLGKNDGNDAFQETFVRFYKYAQKTTIESVPAMLTTIARNTCIDFKRRRKHTITIEDDTLILADTSSLSFAYEQQELMRLVEIGLEYLDFEIREAFVLKHYQDLSYQEIATLTGVPETTVTKRIWRAKERLKHVLSPFINDLNQF
jgi:RNA polymerase sigma-70 factor (ECF subfamily)